MNNNASNYYAPVGMNHGIGDRGGERQQYSNGRQTLTQEHQIFQAGQLPINDPQQPHLQSYNIPQNVANRRPPLYNNLKPQNNGMTAPRQPS